MQCSKSSRFQFLAAPARAFSEAARAELIAGFGNKATSDLSWDGSKYVQNDDLFKNLRSETIKLKQMLGAMQSGSDSNSLVKGLPPGMLISEFPDFHLPSIEGYEGPGELSSLKAWNSLGEIPQQDLYQRVVVLEAMCNMREGDRSLTGWK